MIYKCTPYIYYERPSEEDRYALFMNNAQLIRRDVSSTISLQSPLSYSKGRKWVINKGKKENVIVEQSNDYRVFWEILLKVLNQYHQAVPVHSVDEIEQLAKKFTENIKLFVARKNGNMIAGAVIFENKNIVHTQYLANSEEGRLIGALDLVIDYLITNVYKEKSYFDFGISNEQQGRFLNTGFNCTKRGFWCASSRT